MVAILVEVSNANKKGTVEVIPKHGDTQKYTLINDSIKNIEISLNDKTKPVEVFIHGKVGSASIHGLLVLLYEKEGTSINQLCICLGHNPDGTKKSYTLSHGGDRVGMTFTAETDGSFKSIKIAVNGVNGNIEEDYDLLENINKN